MDYINVKRRFYHPLNYIPTYFEQSLLVTGLAIRKANVRELALGRISRTLVAIKLYLTLLFDKVVLTTCLKGAI